MKKRILLVRTHCAVGTGGPRPPLELLYIASMIMNNFKNEYELKILDIGVGALSFKEIKGEIAGFDPQIICLSSLVWEAHSMHKITDISKKINKNTTVLVHGQIANLAKEYLLQDENIDFVIVGEGEITICELLDNLDKKGDFSRVDGIIYRLEEKTILTNPRLYIENLDDIIISSTAWDLVDVKAYAKSLSWNGSLKEKFYIPILTSRGCPFDCTFCCTREVAGKKFRARSPENVLSEIKFLYEKYNVREIHFFDAVFNYDIERAKKICSLIINSGMKISLAFPHGVRADIMTKELIILLREAGAYKLTYGIETATPRLQKMIKKNLNLNQVRNIIRETSETGIIVGGYFMLGFPTETYDEMTQTIDFAVNSDLDIASFFKVTLLDDIVKFYKAKLQPKAENKPYPYSFEDISYYSRERSHSQSSVLELNNVILKAQQKFYLNLRRICRGILKFPHKGVFLKNLIIAFGLILQSYLIRQLSSPSVNGNNLKKDDVDGRSLKS
ncbi:MAG: radical SAM protein [Candidatus Omnitrophica bacterium]|nr:radical SAM protein [Candidatus Omnitrophota bacterium]